jgi:hypothetical protein
MSNGSSSNTSGANVATVDFSAKGGSDLISDKSMEEVARRLEITFEQAGALENVILSATEPAEADRDKIWFQIDPITNVLIGQAKIFDSVSGTWISPASQDTPYIPPLHRYVTNFSPAGASTINFVFEDIKTEDYMIVLVPTTNIAGAWLIAPGSFPTHFGYTVIGKTNTTVQVAFFGVPTNGIQWEMDIFERL